MNTNSGPTMGSEAMDDPGETGAATAPLETLGQYRLLRKLGAGGMGVVYQAEDVHLRRLAALKVMLPKFNENPEARARFFREARAAALLSNDHIVTVYQVDEDRGVLFIAMEFLRGKSLEDWLRTRKTIKIGEALTVGKQIAKGLAAAHAAGLIHRDVKPANLWLEAPSGRIKILDFGLARLDAAESAALTRDGHAVGTPAFMAPEQARGEAVDGRCDLFSLGCVLYRMLGGRLPFDGDSVYAVIVAVMTAQPPNLRELNSEVPPRLAELVNRLLAKSAADRPQSAAAVLQELQSIEREWKQTNRGSASSPEAETLDLVTTGLPTARPRRVGLISAIVAVLIVGAGAAVYFSAPKQSTVQRELIPAPPGPVPEVKPAAEIDLLALAIPAVDGVKGKWRIESRPTTRLIGAKKEDPPVFVLKLRAQPPPDYLFAFTVKRVGEEEGLLHVGLGLGDERTTMLVDAHPPSGGNYHTGLDAIDGMPMRRRGDSWNDRVLPPNQPVRIIFTVHPRRITMTVDAKLIYSWEGDPAKLRRQFNYSSEPLFIGGVGNATFEFSKVTLKPIAPAEESPMR